jgi:hypothetical protein
MAGVDRIKCGREVEFGVSGASNQSKPKHGNKILERVNPKGLALFFCFRLIHIRYIRSFSILFYKNIYMAYMKIYIYGRSMWFRAYVAYVGAASLSAVRFFSHIHDGIAGM